MLLTRSSSPYIILGRLFFPPIGNSSRNEFRCRATKSLLTLMNVMKVLEFRFILYRHSSIYKKKEFPKTYILYTLLLLHMLRLFLSPLISVSLLRPFPLTVRWIDPRAVFFFFKKWNSSSSGSTYYYSRISLKEINKKKKKKGNPLLVDRGRKEEERGIRRFLISCKPIYYMRNLSLPITLYRYTALLRLHLPSKHHQLLCGGAISIPPRFLKNLRFRFLF